MDFLEPACPICCEPYDTEPPEKSGDMDRRPVLLPRGDSVCSCCHAQECEREHGTGRQRTGEVTSDARPLNLSLIDFIIEQQHRRAASVPPIQEQEPEDPEEVLRDIAKSLIAAGHACPASPTNTNATSLESYQSLCCHTRETTNWHGASEFTSLPGHQARDNLPVLNSTVATESVQLPVLAVREASDLPTPGSAALPDLLPSHSNKQVLSLTMLSSLLHLDRDTCSNGQHKPKLVTTCIESIHMLPVDEAPLSRPTACNPEAGFEVAECSTMRLFLAPPASPAMPSGHASQSCTAGATDNTTRPRLQSCRCDSSGSSLSSASGLSMGAVSRSEQSQASLNSCGGAMRDPHSMDSVGSFSTPDAALRTVQGGTLDIPAGVSIDLQGDVLYSNVHFRGLGSIACIRVHGTAVKFVDCTFEACDVVVLRAAHAAFDTCKFLRCGGAVCATGTHARVYLKSCRFSKCAEALSVSTGARMRATDCTIRDCTANGMHVTTHGHLGLHACVVKRVKGHGIRVGDSAAAKLSRTEIHACKLGPLQVCSGARMSIMDACHFE